MLVLSFCFIAICTVTIRMAQMLYEPKYPPAFDRSTMSSEQCSYSEEMMFGWNSKNYVVVGRLLEHRADCDAVGSAAASS